MNPPGSFLFPKGITMITITRKFEFDAGHRVVGHENKCANLHGHRYVAEVTMTTPTLDPLGRVIDFGEIKKTIGTWIDINWDHRMLLFDEDPVFKYIEGILTDLATKATKETFQQNAFKAIFGPKPPVMLNCNPTAENLAEILFGICDDIVPEHVAVSNLRLYETPNCWADFGCCR